MSANQGLAKVEESLRMQSILMTGVRVLRALLTIGIPIVLVRVLDQETFGVYKQISLISMTAVGILSLSLPASLFYFVPRMPERSQAFVLQTMVVFSIVSAIGGAVVALNPELLARWFGPALAQYSLWLGVIIGLSMNSLLDAVMVVDRRVQLAAVRSATLDLLHGALVVAAAVITRDLHWILAMLSLTILLRVVALVAYIHWRGKITPTSDRTWALREQLSYALPFYVAALVATARDQLHAFFAAANYDAAQFAIYAIGTIQLPFVSHMMQSIGETIVLENSKNFAAGNTQEMRRVWLRATYIVALIMLPLFFMMEVFAVDIISLVFGADYAGAASVWRVFVIMLPLSILLGATMLRATGDLNRIILADSISLAVTIAALLLLMKPLGILAAVWSIVLGNAALSLIVSGRVMHRLGMRVSDYLEWRRILYVALVAAACAGASYLVTRGLPLWLRAFVGPGLAGAAYLAVAWVTGLIPQTERQSLQNLWRKVASRLPGKSAN